MKQIEIGIPVVHKELLSFSWKILVIKYLGFIQEEKCQGNLFVYETKNKKNKTKIHREIYKICYFMYGKVKS
jgi:hypothetical protein